MKRTLRLSRETLTELTETELADIAGADAITQNCNTLHFCHVPTLPLLVCLEPR